MNSNLRLFFFAIPLFIILFRVSVSYEPIQGLNPLSLRTQRSNTQTPSLTSLNKRPSLTN